MSFIKRNIRIILFVILLGSILQSIRMGILIDWSKSKNYVNEINYSNAVTFSKDIISQYEEGTILILYDNSETSLRIKQNLSSMLSGMKKKFYEYSVDDFDGNYINYSNVIVTFEKWDSLYEIDKLFAYIETGGKVLFAVSPDNTTNSFMKYYRKLGVYEYGDYVKYDGIKVISEILINSNNEEFLDNRLFASGLSVRLDTSCSVYAVSEKGNPLVWGRDLGSGHLVVFNGYILEDKINRGIIKGMLCVLNETYLYPIINAKVIFIDDFPAPFYGGDKDEQLLKNYNRKYKDFIRDIWWPDMVAVMSAYNLVYTGMYIQTYNDKVTPPFENINSQTDNLRIYGRELIKKGELGFHGYNHQSLVVDQNVADIFNYYAWNSIDDMIMALKQSKSILEKTLPEYKIYSYVPPSNVLSKEGRVALKAVFPDLKVISGLFNEEDEYSLFQEFSIGEDGIVDFPRFSSGLIYDSNIKWLVFNGISNMGVFSHFIHPDDVIDEERGQGLSWDELQRNFTDIMSDLSNKYGWLESLKSSQAAEKTKNYVYTELHYKYNHDSIKVLCNNFTSELDVILYSKKGVRPSADYHSIKISDNYYLLKLKRPQTIIYLEGE